MVAEPTITALTVTNNKGSDEFTRTVLPQLLLGDTGTKSVDGSSRTRLSAVVSALVETAIERRPEKTLPPPSEAEVGAEGVSSNRNSENTTVTVTSMELFAVALTALEGVFGRATSSEGEEDGRNSHSSSSVPILRVLEVTIPHVPSAFFFSQFSLLSRLMRGWTVVFRGGGMLVDGLRIGGGGGENQKQQTKGKRKKQGKRKRGREEDNNETGGPASSSSGGEEGTNAQLRQVLRTCTRAMEVCVVRGGGGGGVKMEKTALQLMNETIAELFCDRRPKVRKVAYECTMELLALESGRLGSLSGWSVCAFFVQHTRSTLSEYIQKQEKKGEGAAQSSVDLRVQTIHLIQFCASVVQHIPWVSMALIGDDAVRLAVEIVRIHGQDNTGNIVAPSSRSAGDWSGPMAVVNALLVLIHAVIGDTDTDAKEVGREEKSEARRRGCEELSCKVLASLIQIYASVSSWKVLPSDEYYLRQAQLMSTCSVVLSGTDVGRTLLPTVLSVLLKSCRSSSISSDDMGREVDTIRACASEMQRCIRGGIDVETILDMTNTTDKGTNTNTTDGGSNARMKCIASCIRSLSDVLHHDYRERWEILLPVYTTFLCHVGQCRVIVGHPTDGPPTTTDLFSFHDPIKIMLRKLVEMHEDVEDEGSRKAIENGVSLVIVGVDIERFWKVVPLDERRADNDDNNSNKKKKSSTDRVLSRMCIGTHRSWILPLFHGHAKDVGSSTGIPPRIAFFETVVLSLARKCDAMTETSSSSSLPSSKPNKPSALEVSVARSQCIDLWRLLESFLSRRPSDIVERLPGLAGTLIKALTDRRYPELVTIICGSLKSFASTMDTNYNEGENEDKDSKTRATMERETFGKVSEKLLPVLFRLVDLLGIGEASTTKSNTGGNSNSNTSPSLSSDESRTQRIHDVTTAIRSLVPFVPPAFLETLFRKLLTKFLRLTTGKDASMMNNDDDNNNTKSDEDAINRRIASLLDLSHALGSSPALPSASVSLLYRAVKPLLQAEHVSAAVQKRAYKTVATLCETHPSAILAINDGDDDDDNPTKFQEFANVLVGSLSACQVASRSVRLQCFHCIMPHLDVKNNNAHEELTKSILGEVLLCLKDSNAKTRESAYQLLLSMSRLYDDADVINDQDTRDDAINNNDDSNNEMEVSTTEPVGLQKFIGMVVGGLAGNSSTMRSAAVMGLSRLVFEYGRHHSSVQALLPSLLETVIMFLDDDGQAGAGGGDSSREVIQSVISFIRVCVSAIAKDRLEPLLPKMLEGLFRNDRGRGRFREKIKIVLKRLVRRYGYAKLAPLVPEKRLVTHMRKMDARAKRKRIAAAQEGGHDDDNDGRTRVTAFDDMMDSDEGDSDCGRTLVTGMTTAADFTRMTSGRSRMTSKSSAISVTSRTAATGTTTRKSSRTTNKGGDDAGTKRGGPRIQEERDGEVFDLLDPRMSKRVHFQDNKNEDNDSYFGSDNDDDNFNNDGGDEWMEFDESGRLVIHDESSNPSRHSKKVHNDEDDDDASVKAENSVLRYGTKYAKAKETKAQKSAERSRKKQKTSSEKNTVKHLGASYKSKKAGGDVKKKGQTYEPYAFVPLDGKSYTKKYRGKAVSQMATVVKKGKRKR